MKNALRQQLNDLQQTLIRHALWEAQAPHASALASTEPFCVDTLNATQWLQWIFIPRMHALLDANAPLPRNFTITAYLEEALKEHASLADLHAVVLRIETLLKTE